MLLIMNLNDKTYGLLIRFINWFSEVSCHEFERKTSV
jgi:hypothetical protein